MAYCGVNVIAMKFGGGLHEWQVSLENVMRFTQVSPASWSDIILQTVRLTSQLVNFMRLLYGPIIFLTKLSLLLQVHRLFVPTKTGTYRYLIFAMILLNLCFYLAYPFVLIFQCIPRRKISDPRVSGRCINSSIAVIVAAVFNVVSDLCIFVLVLAKVWTLNISIKQKRGLSIIFGCGLL